MAAGAGRRPASQVRNVSTATVLCIHADFSTRRLSLLLLSSLIDAISIYERRVAYRIVEGRDGDISSEA